MNYLKEFIHNTLHGFHVLTTDATLHNIAKNKIPLDNHNHKNISTETHDINHEKATIIPNSVDALAPVDIHKEQTFDFMDNKSIFDNVFNENMPIQSEYGLSKHITDNDIKPEMPIEKPLPNDLFKNELSNNVNFFEAF